ncbi:uncharacterized protein N7459_009697 [Penicillium hispanicum]|uniref:uncharacterized protein n=1 Tax=Penicillium hispanicum TaxID=1080232 RepID=UPI002540E64F|nr:uncharacterized protein N7459_009697 [Penicillium hispanicum]KAJ5570267.1 hypothetical protein N7459_009697 [Penicillium hispanicum]
MTGGSLHNEEGNPSQWSVPPVCGFQAVNMPANGFSNAGQRPAAPNNEASPYGSTFSPSVSNQYSAYQSNTPNSTQYQASQSSLDRQTPQPLPPFLPPAPFDNYDATSWNQTGLNSNQPHTLPSMPFLNPNFFNPMAVGNTQIPFSMLPFPSMLPFQSAQPMSTSAGVSAQPPIPQRTRAATPPVKRPAPSDDYLQQASQPPQICPQRPLLVILDMNGTLILRKHKKFPPSFHRRVGLDHFLDTISKKYTVMIWSSSKPQTIEAVATQLFPKGKKKPIALWGRDKFGLTSAQYNSKLQVYKELHKVWASPQIQAAYPGNNGNANRNLTRSKAGKFAAKKKNNQGPENGYPVGHRWDQTNTILIDDSRLKALSEPYNILEIPEFTNPTADPSAIFEKVLSRLDALSRHDDVSKVLREWNARLPSGGSILDLDIGPEIIDLDSDPEDGGASLLPSTGSMHADQNASLNPAGPVDAKEAARLRKERSKARKADKKAAKRAAKEAAKANAASNRVVVLTTDPDTLGSGEGHVSTEGSLMPSTQQPQPQNQTPNQNQPSRRKRNKKKGSNFEREFFLSVEVTPEPEVPGGPRYNFRSRTQAPVTEAVQQDRILDAGIHPGLAPAPGHANGLQTAQASTESIAAEIAERNTTSQGAEAPVPSMQSQTSPFRIDPARSVSPVSESGSENSLLDRLEEGLFPKK